MHSPKLLLVAAVLAVMAASDVRAQYVGGGTPDLFNGAAGSNGPTSYEGQRSKAGTYDADDQGPDAEQSPPPATPAKVKAKRKVKARQKPHKIQPTKPAQPTEAAPQ